VRNKFEEEKKQAENERAKVRLADKQKRMAEEAASLQATFEQEQLRLQNERREEERNEQERLEVERRAEERRMQEQQECLRREEERREAREAEAKERARREEEDKKRNEQERLEVERREEERRKQEQQECLRREEERREAREAEAKERARIEHQREQSAVIEEARRNNEERAQEERLQLGARGLQLGARECLRQIYFTTCMCFQIPGCMCTKTKLPLAKAARCKAIATDEVQRLTQNVNGNGKKLLAHAQRP
jgi:hypothetical protein